MNKILPLLIAALILFACDPDPIVEVCVNHHEDNQRCGTGFFIEQDRVLTSAHMVEKSEDGVVVIKKRGRNIKSSSHHKIEGRDIQVVSLTESEDVDPLEICPDVPPLGTWVEIFGVFGQYGDNVETTIGALLSYDNNEIRVLTTGIRDGFSGGPMVDYYNDCVIGVTHGENSEYSFGYVITDLKL